MMRIAIAGSGGLAQHFAHFINQTPHPFIILSREEKPHLEGVGYQVVVVNYDEQESLQFALRGVDLVISTVSGVPQINLIDAAARSQVRRFVPSEFEGPPTRRPDDDPFDRGRAASLARLREFANRPRGPMKFTIFTCGVFYERFAPGGLASKGVGLGSGLDYQGAFLLDIESNQAEVIQNTAPNRPVYLCMTAMSDVARFLVAALDLGINDWPPEFRLCGDRKSVAQLIEDAENIKGTTFHVWDFNPGALAQHLQYALATDDHLRAVKLQALVATANRHYDFSQPTLNERVDVRPISFRDWLARNWAP